MHIKKFLQWIGLKERLDAKISTAPFISEGEIWWASLGENVGGEINGKSHLFTRPVLIFRKFSNNFYFVIPLTTQKRVGSWYVNYKKDETDITACLHQARSIDYRRFYSKLGELAENDREAVKIGFKKLYQT